MLFLILATAGVAMGSAIPSLVSRATDPTTWPFVLSDAGSVETNLVANLPKVTYTVSNWAGAPALMPDPCVDTNGWAGVDPSKTPLLDICGFQVKSVKFSDCEKPTVVCYHKDAGLTLTEFLDVSFGPLIRRVFRRVELVANNSFRMSPDFPFAPGLMLRE